MKTYNIDNKTPKNGYDANCVVKYKDNIIVAGTRGYEIFEPKTGFAHSYVASPGKAKHLAVSGSNLTSQMNWNLQLQLLKARLKSLPMQS